ncbi:MAG: ABC transporter substrate-binding protein [Oligoflexus sp.]
MENLRTPCVRISMTPLLAILIFSCLFGCSSCEDSREKDALRIGLIPWAPFEYFFLAEQQGYFKELGVNVQLLEYQTLQDVRRAFERGHLDGIGCTLIEVAQVYVDSRRNLQVVYFTDDSMGSDVILANPPIHSVPDLKGRRVGVKVASLGIFVLAKALEQHNMSLSDVEIIPFEESEIVSKLKRHLVDAVVAFPPFSLEIERQSKVQQIFSTKELPGLLQSGLAFESSMIANRSEDIARVILAYEKAKQYAEQNPSAFDFMARREQIDAQALHQVFQSIHLIGLEEQDHWLGNDERMQTILEEIVQVLKAANQVPESADANITGWNAKPTNLALKMRRS